MVVLASPLQLTFLNSLWLHTGMLPELIAYHTAEPIAGHKQVQPALHYQRCFEKQQKVEYPMLTGGKKKPTKQKSYGTEEHDPQPTFNSWAYCISSFPETLPRQTLGKGSRAQVFGLVHGNLEERCGRSTRGCTLDTS